MYIGCFHIRLLCVMAIICQRIPLYVLIGAGHQVINVSASATQRTGSVSPLPL